MNRKSRQRDKGEVKEITVQNKRGKVKVEFSRSR